MRKKTIGLVIQGPLVSIGRTGNRLHESPDKLMRESGVVHYDCRDNISRIIKEFGHLFDQVVVSTWDNEVKAGDSWRGAKIISAPDPGGIKQVRHYKNNNKHRQFISTLNGLKELEKSGIDYAIKTRTDLYLDFEKLIESFFTECEKHSNPKAIGATVIHPPNFLLHDLYFMAELEALKKFCEAIIEYDKFEFISSVHREIVLKPAFVLYRDVINVPNWSYFPIFPPDGVSAETKKIFKYMFENIYFSLDPEIWKGTLWRGTHFAEEHFSSLLGSKNQEQRRYNPPALFTIDWRRYFTFRLLQTGKKIGIGSHLKVIIGEVGWRLWNILRKIVRTLKRK